ncbi:MAG: ATP-binding protein [Nitrospirae bacterium]|uniref:ATP-binding protein n=1 Tax=Candidatus Magnetobacterium casense TaxID=1455061 RepID=UPI00058BEF6C|nr:ATP-binding protein [Candidatus Magnetobacterium casensis]MBF0338679.1 ATP-binding protein [Nitrospirota bacterium]
MKTKGFPAVLDSLSPIREFVTEEAKEVGLDKKKTYNLALAIDEIAANVINYGYIESGLEGVIDFEVQSSDNQLMVFMYDDSEPFDPFQREKIEEETLQKPLEDRPIGGLGIFLAINGVDEVKYNRIDNRNRYTFVVTIN